VERSEGAGHRARHMLLRVDLDGRLMWRTLGFGVILTLTARFVVGARLEQVDAARTFRLPAPGHELRDGSQDRRHLGGKLYRFICGQLLPDYEVTKLGTLSNTRLAILSTDLIAARAASRGPVTSASQTTNCRFML